MFFCRNFFLLIKIN